MNGRHLVTATEAAHILGIPVGTIYAWRSAHHITPALIDAHGHRLYALDEITTHARTSGYRPRRRAHHEHRP